MPATPPRRPAQSLVDLAHTLRTSSGDRRAIAHQLRSLAPGRNRHLAGVGCAGNGACAKCRQPSLGFLPGVPWAPLALLAGLVGYIAYRALFSSRAKERRAKLSAARRSYRAQVSKIRSQYALV